MSRQYNGSVYLVMMDEVRTELNTLLSDEHLCGSGRSLGVVTNVL